MAGSCKNSRCWLDDCEVFPAASPSSLFRRNPVWKKLQQCDRQLPAVCLQRREKNSECALESFESVEKDDLLDVLEAHDCHHLASEETIAALVSQLGHKTLIQTPMFVIECWKPILQTLADTLYPRRLVDMMEERVPTPKRVRELLKFPEEMTAVQNTVARHLKKYKGESDKTIL